MKPYYLFPIAILIGFLSVKKDPLQRQWQQIIHGTPPQQQQPHSFSGNRKIDNFLKAKQLLKRKSFPLRFSFYCNCAITQQRIDLGSCPYKPMTPDNHRSQQVEWEHIVPASAFGKKFTAWEQGDQRCQTKSGKKYKGRRCARKTSKKFRFMEADLYNLVPVIGEVNQLRHNFPLGQVANGLWTKDQCPTLIGTDAVEPSDAIKGWIARIYRYMDHAYPGYDIINPDNQQLIESWDKAHPPTPLEHSWALYIEKIQGNRFYIQ